LKAMTTGLCSVISAVTINADAFDGISGPANEQLWSGTRKEGHLGELILQKLPNLRRVQITTPGSYCRYRIPGHSPDDTCTQERYSTCSLCAQFFSGQLKRGRIDTLEFIMGKEASQMTTQKDILSTDPAYRYWAACDEPWSQFKMSKKVEKYSGPHKSQIELGCHEWTVSYKRQETRHEL
jgi:hypothetical protein